MSEPTLPPALFVAQWSQATSPSGAPAPVKLTKPSLELFTNDSALTPCGPMAYACDAAPALPDKLASAYRMPVACARGALCPSRPTRPTFWSGPAIANRICGAAVALGAEVAVGGAAVSVGARVAVGGTGVGDGVLEGGGT